MQVPKKRWLIPAALAACLLLIDFRALFPPHTFRELSNGLLKTGEHLMTPFSMVLVALAIAAAVAAMIAQTKLRRRHDSLNR